MARRTTTLDLGPIVAGVAAPAEHDPVTAQVLDATAGLIADFGLARWSVDDVAGRSGLGRTTVYRRFEGREQLVQAVMVREVRRFIDAIAEAVAHHDDLGDQVVEGMLVALRSVQASVLPGLLRSDGATVLPLLTTEAAPLVAACRTALVDRYRASRPPGAPDGPDVDLVADALVRLSVSWLVTPSPLVDLDDEAAARSALRRIVLPLLALP